MIVGAGLAGAKAAEALRAQGFDGRIVLLGDEPHRPYERPPLSKDYLSGKSEREQVFVHTAAWYGEHDVDLRTGQAVTAIDRTARRVTLADGGHVGYDKLLLTTGAGPRRLPVPGGDAGGVHYLRTLGDSEQIKETLATAARIVVIGGGWIGLEVTAVARQAGVEVTLIEAAELPLLSVLGQEAAGIFADLHRAHGVDLRCGAQITAITTDGQTGRATGVRMADGTTIDADAVIIGVGISANVQLAADAGLDVDNGVLVDATLTTSDPDICAAGDVANALHPVLGTRVRVEHWANATAPTICHPTSPRSTASSFSLSARGATGRARHLLRSEIPSVSAMVSASMARSPLPSRSRAWRRSLSELVDVFFSASRSGPAPCSSTRCVCSAAATSSTALSAW